MFGQKALPNSKNNRYSPEIRGNTLCHDTGSQHGLLYCLVRPRFTEIMYHNYNVGQVPVLTTSHGSECAMGPVVIPQLIK